ncbi:methyl-accepting chemotaxis protein [Aliikangiella sp. G2MR2-5]|uniref:methyl-accepting chemotaxis protein n=1 Tax=Aliikangiella sp. G2MR2-5 TaxID=2788943 RepID=UPI0018AA512E|nr:methyl-accepting chemotaxis protein [Aliikangiella sp. G2MR2-5]
MIQHLLAPGTRVIGHLSLTRKFLLIFLLYLFPVTYITYYALTKHKIAIDNTQDEITSLALIHEFRPVFVNMAKSRGLTNAYLNGNQQTKSKAESARQIVDQSLASIASSKSMLNLRQSLKTRISDISNEWETLKLAAFGMKPEESFQRHSMLINEVLSVTNAISEQSRLMTDPEPHTAFLISSFVKEIPSMAEITGQTRGMGAGIAAKGSFNSETYIALSNYFQQLSNLHRAINHSFNSATNISSELAELTSVKSEFDSGVNEFLNTTKNKMLDPDKIQISSDEYFNLGTSAIEQALALYEKTFDQLNNSFSKRLDAIYAEIWLNLLSSAGLILTALYLFASFSQSMRSSIGEIKSCVNKVAQGDLTARTKITTTDEMRDIGRDVNRMVDATQALVSKVLSATEDLVSTAEQNNESAAITSSKIRQQNVEVEQVATAMNEMQATVQEVASNAEQAAASTANADKDSKAGFEIVQSTISAISELANELEVASGSINELRGNVQGIGSVLDVIQGIADQTNLLALNAAIEAARAGESGRGFAVVADEVRTLASKTQESTEEIRQMIDKLQTSADLSVRSMSSGTEKSKQTVEEAEKAGAALQQISDSVSHISAMGEQIAAAASQQSSVADEINRSIMSVKDISEDTSKSAINATERGRFLSDVASNLKSLVAQFKVS